MTTTTDMLEKRIRLDDTDIEVSVRLHDGSMRIDVSKADYCIHSVIIDNANTPIENGWMADLLAREDQVNLRDLASDVDRYLVGSNINQG